MHAIAALVRQYLPRLPVPPRADAPAPVVEPAALAEYRAATAKRLAAADAVKEARRKHDKTAPLIAQAKTHCTAALDAELRLRGVR